MKRAKRLLAVWLAVALTMCGCWAEGADDAAEMAVYEQDDTVLDPTEEVVFQDSAAGEYLSGALTAVNEMQNILLLGIDARPGESTGRSDTMIILTVDADQNVIRMVSLMRDLYVEGVRARQVFCEQEGAQRTFYVRAGDALPPVPKGAAVHIEAVDRFILRISVAE